MKTETLALKSNCYRITLHGETECLWSYRTVKSEGEFRITPPVFEVDGHARAAVLTGIAPGGEPIRLSNGATEYRFTGRFAEDQDLSLELVFRVTEDNPVVRFRYVLHSAAGRKLTKTQGRDALTYLGIESADSPLVKEVRFSEFNGLAYSFVLVEEPVAARQFEDAAQVMGPMLVGGNGRQTWLVAYEHGSQVPDAFLSFHLTPGRAVSLRAVKGNYWNGQPLGPDQPYATIWLQFAAVNGSERELADAYRTFVLRHMTLNAESRKPYIFYNTWAYQERNNAWKGTRFLDSMHQEHILHEIEIAHRMAIDVFVLDTGWYEKTGDWRVNLKRFPDGLKAVKEKLDGYGMKLGLWFGPLHAALTSAMHKQHQDCIVSWRGKPAGIHQIWETEESQNLCLVSRYADAFADELIRLVKNVGVTYFKWDAIGQYGCDDPGHWHGDASTTPEDRADSYAFQLGLAMAHVVDRLCAACPEAIVDFDITEGGRYVGLGFLAAGKYFLMNNGPYFRNYNIPDVVRNWNNIFVWPGPARGWVCRTPLTFDKWIPSVLFLTHYLPDDPADSQIINIASLILGQNGIWGDLPAMSEEGVARFGHLLRLYKQVRDDVTEASPIITGHPAGSQEIYEKISPRGRGAVCLFTSAGGRYTYITEHPVVPEFYATDGAQVTFDAKGRAIITCAFERAGAKIVYFGVSA